MYAPAELIDQTEYALNIATTVLDFYETYYGISYPLHKSGEIALYPCTCTYLCIRLSACRFFPAHRILDLVLFVYYLCPHQRLIMGGILFFACPCAFPYMFHSLCTKSL